MYKRTLHTLHLMKGALLRPLRDSGPFIAVIVTLYLTNSLFTHFPPSHKAEGFSQLLLDLYLYASIIMLLPPKWRRWLRSAGCIAMYVLCILESFLAMRFNMRISPSMIMLCMDTTGTESSEFLLLVLKTWHTYAVITAYGAILLLHSGIRLKVWRLPLAARTFGRLAQRLQPTADRIRPHIRPAATTLAVATLATALWGVPRWVERQRAIMPFFMLRDSRTAERCNETNFYSPALRIAWSIKFYSLMLKEADEIAANTLRLRVDGCTFRCPKIVLIIGESHNKHHSSLYGYNLTTAPHQQALASKGQLVAFTDAVSPWNLTSNVFKDIMSTHSCNEPGRWTDGVLFPAIFKRAGYNVAFLSNQFYAGKSQTNCDVNGSFFLNRSDMNAACFDLRSTNHYTTDGIFLDKELAPYRHHDHELVIVHLYGQHTNYADRTTYDSKGSNPPPFSPNDYTRPDLSPGEVQTLADYDNACIYNDMIIRQIYNQFADEEAIFIYVSDHGEYIFDGDDHRFGRHHDTTVTRDMARNEFEVPLTIFFTTSFAQRHPDIVQRTRAVCSLPFATDDLPHLLMGLAGITSPHYAPRHDILHPDYDTTRPRLLRGNEDYDKIMGRR